MSIVVFWLLRCGRGDQSLAFLVDKDQDRLLLHIFKYMGFPLTPSNELPSQHLSRAKAGKHWICAQFSKLAERKRKKIKPG